MMNFGNETLLELVARGFHKSARNEDVMEFVSGSIANYTKCKVHTPHSAYSLNAGCRVPACYVEYEDFAESGQIEVDGHIIEKSTIAVSELFNYLEKKGIYNIENERKEREAREREMWARFQARKRGNK